MEAVLKNRVVVLNQIFGEHQTPFGPQSGKSTKGVHFPETAVQHPNQHPLAFKEIIVEAFSVDLGDGRVAIGVLITGQSILFRIPVRRRWSFTEMQRAQGFAAPSKIFGPTRYGHFHHGGVQQPGSTYHAQTGCAHCRQIGRMHRVVKSTQGLGCLLAPLYTFGAQGRGLKQSVRTVGKINPSVGGLWSLCRNR